MEQCLCDLAQSSGMFAINGVMVSILCSFGQAMGPEMLLSTNLDVSVGMSLLLF